ncbi:PIG-L family deacetylase [Deinococcus humi]|uniref:N-acetyl-1-D-myo-inositol-2-amino-2-deoxy-alpha-D-glucopyranoside deacetylase n=1 Tax=Deinococcus humi TaxID=662880 RepID=A0A7W8NE54_9DEIO|nr:PIG-L family deacetylase [Deinococcus humi]MBB5363944.1 N-acetyl-1-D-myo-inositol-2-amino-2-deoxy-alpha-D-glucopyranoside deacetylase [Deinococcus humi]GGO32879.1 PIG-L domain-containing protein [Deinococcus humi]
MSSPAALLAVFAHPDDEALRCGGTLALYAARGAQVHLICLTRGEAGRNTDPELGDIDMPTQREQELRNACAALGIHPPIFLDYHDSGRGDRLRRDDPLATINADPGQMERQILEVIETTRPQIMVTFDPHGIYGHPDHLTAHRAATAAYASSGFRQVRVQRLFYTVQSREEMLRLQSGRSLGVLKGLDPETYAVCDSTIAARIDIRVHAARKRAALFSHRTQTGPLSTLGTLSNEQLSPLMATETFSLGGIRSPVLQYPMDDLFAGLDVEFSPPTLQEQSA